ncbi:hypothetical protein DFH09DRAFT_1299981 [Mycena vulgaris]|nr:hypothetical protein DFH09DRAFT_1299981 [Mycena vulgaris]
MCVTIFSISIPVHEGSVLAVAFLPIYAISGIANEWYEPQLDHTARPHRGHLPQGTRHVYYPEKVLLVTIRNLGHCPCPRSLVTKDRLDQIGTIRDVKIRVNSRRVDDEGYRAYVRYARDWIYQSGQSIRSKKAETLLAPKSLVPTTAN